MVQSSPLLSDDDIFGATAPQSGLLSDDDIFGLPSGPSSVPGAMSYGFPVPGSPVNSFLSAASSAPALQDRLASAGGSFMQGAGQTISGVPRAVAIAGAPNLDVLESFDRIDRGEERRFRSGPSGRFSSPDDLVVPPGQAGDIVDRYQAASQEERQAIRAELRARAEGVVNSPAYQAGEAVDQWFAENFPSDPEFQDDFWTSQVPAGLGSAVSFMVAALATRGASSGVGATAEALATFAAPAALGSSLNATDLFSDALSNGADIQDALKAADRGAVVGLSEAVPIFDLLKRTDRVTGGAIRRYLVRAIEQGSEEAVQEAFQGVMNAAIAQDLYDPERGVWTMDRVDESAVGFTTGALLETITSIVLPGRHRAGGSNGNANADETAGDASADPAAPGATSPSTTNPTVSEVRDFARSRIAELQTVSQPSESEAAELAFLTENQDNAQAVASAYGVELQPELLAAPVISVNAAGEASTAAQADDLARQLQTRARDLGLDEVSEAQIGRVPPPDMAAPSEPAQILSLPAPQTVVTPQGEIGTPAQFDARDRTERERRTQLGLDEVANARIDMQPRAEPAGLREQARLAAPQLSDSDLASPIPNDLISHGRAILADAEGAVAANRILDSAGLPPINTEITITTPQGPTRARIDDVSTVDGATSVSLSLPDGRVVRESAARVAQAIQTQPRALDVSGAARIDTTAETAPLPVRAPVLDGQIARSLGPQIGQSSAAVTEGVSPAPRAPVTVREVPDSADVAATPTGRRVPVRYALVEAGSLVSSQLADGRTNPAYPAELQPRDRARAASEGQIRKILDPNEFDPRQLGRSPTAGSGAPIISPEGVVESGNGRTLALTRAYEAGGEVAQRYRDYLTEQGFDVQGMERPVLVRVRDGDMSPDDLQAYTREANTPDIMGMSATEQAMADGAAIPDAMLDLYRGGDVDAVANRPFVREFISRIVGSNASANLIARDGTMNTEATRRIGGALLAKSYGNTAIVEAMTESTDSNIKAIGGALMDVAPLWAKMRGDAASGQSAADMDNTPLLLEAVAIVDRARRERRSIAEYVNQTDMLSGGAIDPITEGFLGLMYHNVTGWTRPVGRNKLAAALRFYIEEAGKTQPGSDMFGQSAPAAGDIIKLARERTIQNDQDARDEPNLFAPATERPGERPRADSQGGVQSDIPQPPAEARGEAAQRGEAGAGQRNVDEGQPATPQPDAPATQEPEAQEPSPPASTTAPSTERIEDFGETLHGARKHYAADYQDRMAEAMEADVASQPLSKVWPAPDYQRLIDDGADPWAVAFVRAARDEVPAKPRVSYRVARWSQDVIVLRDVSNRVLNGEISAERVRELMETPKHARIGAIIQDRADIYQAVGHSQSLKGVSMRAGVYSMLDGKVIDPPQTRWVVQRSAKATAFSNWPQWMAEGTTRAAAIEAFAKRYSEIDTQPPASRQVSFSIYSYRSGPKKGLWVIGKKIGRDHIDLHATETVAEARAYREEHHDDLVAELARRREIPDHRKESNSPRVGADHREGGDVTPEQFAETFGFRGVQFGNYVEGPRRQQDVNNAYDGLMDLAGVLEIPPLALSLNGQLGLAFGARGRGGKKAATAHFEPGSVVINLTKTQGAGSLAHEWWHALDNHFSGRRGAKADFMTASPEAMPGDAIRPEIREAFRELVRTINQTSLRERSRQLDRTRSKPYWATGHEMSARSFESYVIAKLQDQGGANDYLANVVAEDAWGVEAQARGSKDDRYPYPTAGEIPAIRAGFDNLFRTIETRETQIDAPDGTTRPGVEMFRLRPSDTLAPKPQEAPAAPAPTTPTAGDGAQSALQALIRKGEDRRQSDRPAYAKDFQEVFGFRNVTFGKRGDAAEGQREINQAYDALLDLSEILRVPPLALSLNGQLGMAFGAREQGRKDVAAQYERAYGVITLVEVNGAGALAHEWMHAVDHFLGRQDGKASSEMTPNSGGYMVFDTQSRDKDLASHGLSPRGSGVRPEVRDAWHGVLDAIYKRRAESAEDRSKREVAEGLAIERLDRVLDGFRQGLANENPWGAKDGSGLDGHMARVDAALGRIRNGDIGEAREFFTNEKYADLALSEPVIELARILNDALGRQRYGTIADIQGAIDAKLVAEQFIDAAAAERRDDATVKTEFHSEAWLMDRARHDEYWSRADEMVARAFEAYVYDRARAINQRYNFASKEKHNSLPVYETLNIKPFPEGQERLDINSAFDALFEAIQTRETQISNPDGSTRPGVELFRLRPSAEMASKGADVADALADQLADAGLSDRVTLKVRAHIEALADGTIAEADGRYIKGVIEIALDAPSPSRALNHEIIHALRDMGLFRDAEWRTLSRSAMENGDLMSTVRQRYEGLDLSQDAVVEEAVAEMYADWSAGRQERRGFIKAAFDRIASFFEALANGLRGNGFQSASDVFASVQDGETGSRRGVETKSFREWFGDSKVVDESGNPLVVYHGTNADFDAFQVSNLGGIWLSPDANLASTYSNWRGNEGAQVIPAYVQMNNPMWINGPSFWEKVKANMQAAVETFGQARVFRRTRTRKLLIQHELTRTGMFIDAKLRAELDAGGHDGIINERSGEVVVLRPEQIKSAFNRGDFDPTDPRISFALRAGDFSPAQAERAISSILKRDTSREGVTMQPAYAQADGTITPDGGQLDNTVWKKPLALFESATDKLRRSGDDALVDLGNRVDGYFDKNEARIGQVNGPLRPILKKLGISVTSGQGAIEKVTKPFREYWRHMDNGRTAQAEAVLEEADEAIRELVEAVKDLFSDMGTQNQQAGVQVFDAKTNGWRPIGKLPRGGFWPRSLDPKVQAVLQNPSADTALWGRMVDALLNEGHIETREEAKRFLSTYFTNEVKNDYFAGIEKARSVRLPEIFYDYSWGAFQRYAFKWSSRISQIEAFGQGSVFDRAGPPAAKNVFSEIIGATLDKNTRDYVGQVAQHVYSVRSLDGYTAVLDNLNLLATGTQLGNPATATLNLIGGTQLNVQQFGWRRVAKAWGELVTDWDNLQQKGVELGILGKDVLNILRDTEHSDAYFDSNRKIRDALGNFTSWTMTWGGYRGTENLIRATGMIAGRYQLNDALKAWNANPASADSLKYRAYMRRNRIDPDLLVRENGEGPETARYLRLMVNIPQGSYRIDQTPLYVDTQLGKFLFKYQKFGTQVSRMFWQHFMQPFVKTIAPPSLGGQASSGAERVKKFLPLLHWFSAAAVGGTAILAARSFLFNYGDPGTDWDDLADALEDDDLAAKWAMIFDRAWYSMMAGSAFGFFGNYMQMGRDVADQQRVKNPLDPPGLASINSVVELVQRFLEQGTLSGRDVDQIAEGTFAIYRGYKRAGLTAIEMIGLDVAEARLQAARRENRYIRGAARRFADEAGIEARRTSTGRIGRTPRSPLNSAVSEALLVGDGARARLLVQDAMAKASGPQERAQIRSSLRASIRYRQPILVNGPPSAAVRRDFLLWARENTSPANYQTIIEADRRYRNAARVAGVW